MKSEHARQTTQVERRRSHLQPPPSVLRIFFWIMTGALVILLICAFSQTLNRSDEVFRFASQGWPQDAAKVIVQNKITALWHTSFMAAVTAAVFALFAFPRFERVLRFRNGMAAGLVLIVAMDAVTLSKQYIQPMPRSYVEANPLTAFLKRDLGTGRVALLTQQDIYNIWLTYLLPYNQIPTFNFSQMPRMPEDYKNFLAAGSKDPLRMWRFSAVKYLLGPASFEKQLTGQVKKVFAYDLESAPDQGIHLIPRMSGAHAVFELFDPVPRYALLSGFDPSADREALTRLSGNGPLLNGQVTGSVNVVQSRPGRVELKTWSDARAMLRIAERWDPDWKASVDGAPTPVQKIDFLCQGLELSAGTHDVTLAYSPSKLFFYLQCAGYLTLLSALFFGGRLWFGKQRSPNLTNHKSGKP